MFELSQITKALQSFLGEAQAPVDLPGAISAAGLDLEQLQGLAPEQITQMLSEHGIDLSAFAPDQLAELASSVDLGGQVTGAIEGVIERITR
jgi:hypothetical protein